MVSKDDRLSSGGRPSLLSAEQNNPADGRSVLSALDGKAAKAAKPAKADAALKPGAPVHGKPTAQQAPAKGRGVFLWSAAFAALITVAGGGLVWMASMPDEQSLAAQSAPSVPAPAVPAPAAVAAAAVAAPAAAATVEPPESDVSTAAILQDSMASKEPPPAPVAKAKPAADPLTLALERPATKVASVDKPAESLSDHKAEKTRLAHHDAKPEAKKQAPREKPKAQAKAQAEPKQDRDATLLAALMAHTQPNSHIPRKSTPAQQLQICHQYNAAGAEQCRARLCANGAQKEPECKARLKK